MFQVCLYLRNYARAMRTELVGEIALDGDGTEVLCVGAASIQFELPPRLRVLRKLRYRDLDHLADSGLRLCGYLGYLLMLRLLNGCADSDGLHCLIVL